MARYVVTVPSSKSPDNAFAYMADMRLFIEWDRGIKKVEQVVGNGPGEGATFDVTVVGLGGRPATLRYVTTEWNPSTEVVLIGKGGGFTSVDRITVTPTATGCDVTYDAKLSLNGLLSPFNPLLGLIFNKVGDRAAKGLRKVHA
ncbi:MAG: SRPBCC family protein [Ilumatobacteraceae bacterium]